MGSGVFNSNGNLGMGIALFLEDYFSKGANTAMAKFSQLDAQAEVMQKNVSRSLNQMKLGASMLGAGLATMIPIGFGVKKAAEFEQLNIAMSTMLKSSEKASVLIRDLRHFADVTPFSTEDILASGKMLVAFQKPAKEVVGTLKNLGNVAAGVGMPMKTLAEIYGKNLMQPKLMLRDIYQMAGHGIPIIAALAEVFGVANTEVMDMVSAGKAGIPEMEKAFDYMSNNQFAGLMDKQSKSFKGLTSTLKSYASQILENIGKPILQALKPVLGVLINISKSVKAFMDTGIGQFIVKLVFSFSLLLTVGGALMLMFGGLRFAAFNMANMFGQVTKATIIQTLATKGLAAGFRQMAKAALASIIPLLPYIAIGVAIAAPFVGLYFAIKKANKAFKEMEEPAKGYLLFFQRLGGYISVIKEVWSSWDKLTKTFTLSEDLSKKLKKLGLEEMALNLATWVVRIKSFFQGVGEGFRETMSMITSINDWFKSEITSVVDGLEYVGINIRKNTSDIDKWVQAGKIVGAILSASLLGVAAILAVLGVASAAVLGVMVGLGWATVEVWKFIGNSIKFALDLIKELPKYLDIILEKMPVIGGLYQAGKWGYEQVVKFSKSDDDNQTIGKAHQDLNREQMNMQYNPTVNVSNSNTQPIMLRNVMELDGIKIAEKVNEINTENYNR